MEKEIMLKTALAPVWDARIEVDRLRAIVGALWYLSRPHEDDAGLADVRELFGIIEGRLAESAEMLDRAIKKGVIAEE